ncbi:hypothetical protein Tco_0771719 [Tanacetum coccineum]|uniref:Uncharacterized protein n=1 Tax=Tanacetum coccineum TaxID=301880 RepID=A0ABQ4ZFT1_9ASTR
MAYSDKYKKILDGIIMNKIKLDGEIKKEEEEAIKQVKGEALKEKEDPRAFSIPIRLEAKIKLNDLADTDTDIDVMPYRIHAKLGREDVKKCQPGNYHAKPFKGRTYGSSEGCSSDSDDEEDYDIQRNNFGALMYRPKPAKYLNCNDPMDQALALQEVINPFRKICVWKKVVGFLRSLPVPLQHMEWKPNYKGNFCKKEERDGQWHAEIRLTDPYGNSIGTHDDEAGSSSSRPKSARITKNVEEALMGRVLHEFLLVNEMGSNAVLFTSNAWKRAFDINEPIYIELCYDFYATFEFDEAVADDELMTKKSIKFRQCGKAYAMSLRCDDDFSADQYWLNISSEETLTLSRSSVMTRTLDANILRELIGSNGRLIPEDIAPSIPRVATPRAPHPTTSDLVLEHIASHYGFTLRDPYNPPNYFEQQQQHDDQE